MTLPSKSSYDSLGGELLNYADVVDPTTDLDAEFNNETRANVAAMTRTCILAHVTVTGSTSRIGITSHDAVWGNSQSVVPSGTWVATGKYTFTWPATVTDPRNESQSVNFVAGWGNVRGQAAGTVNVTAASPNAITVQCFSGSIANNLVGVTFDLFVVG